MLSELCGGRSLCVPSPPCSPLAPPPSAVSLLTFTFCPEITSKSVLSNIESRGVLIQSCGWEMLSAGQGVLGSCPPAGVYRGTSLPCSLPAPHCVTPWSPPQGGDDRMHTVLPWKQNQNEPRNSDEVISACLCMSFSLHSFRNCRQQP